MKTVYSSSLCFLNLLFLFNIFFVCFITLLSTDQSLEPERLERQKRICWLKEKVKALQDQENTVNQEVEQFEQAIEKDKQEHVRIK